MKKIVEFYLEEDKKNKQGAMLLIAVAEDGSKYVVCGNPHFPTNVTPYGSCWYTKDE